jgi:hypothetical protein
MRIKLGKRRPSIQGKLLRREKLYRFREALFLTGSPYRRIILSDKDRDFFLKTLANPPPLNDKLKEAFQEYQRRNATVCPTLGKSD